MEIDVGSLQHNDMITVISQVTLEQEVLTIGETAVRGFAFEGNKIRSQASSCLTLCRLSSNQAKTSLLRNWNVKGTNL